MDEKTEAAKAEEQEDQSAEQRAEDLEPLDQGEQVKGGGNTLGDGG